MEARTVVRSNTKRVTLRVVEVETLLDSVKAQLSAYNNRCLDESVCIEVLDITRHTLPIAIGNRYYTDVTFRYKAAVYSKGDIVLLKVYQIPKTGPRIVKLENDHITATLNLMRSGWMRPVGMGDLVAVSIGQCIYKNGNKMSALTTGALPYPSDRILVSSASPHTPSPDYDWKDAESKSKVVKEVRAILGITGVPARNEAIYSKPGPYVLQWGYVPISGEAIEVTQEHAIEVGERRRRGMIATYVELLGLSAQQIKDMSYIWSFYKSALGNSKS